MGSELGPCRAGRGQVALGEGVSRQEHEEGELSTLWARKAPGV